MDSLSVRVNGELNDFVHRSRRRNWFRVAIEGRPSVKDVLESLGIPHPEIGLILCDDTCVDFSYGVCTGVRIDVYPHGCHLTADPSCLLPFVPAELKFIADVHLGGVVRLLRLAGIDVSFSKNDPGDAELARLSAEQGRILLTRDRNLLKRSVVKYGYWLRKTGSQNQFHEVVERYRLRAHFNPFSRCVHCNARILPVAKELVADQLAEQTRFEIEQFWQCQGCGHVYWKGSHFKNIRKLLSLGA